MYNKLKKEITIFFTALVYFTRIPCYKLANYSEECMRKIEKYSPLVGIIVGSIGAIVYILASLILPDKIAILLSMISTILATGALHEDGFADFCDGFGGGHTKEQILKIMKDSCIGTYAAVGLICILGLKFFTLKEIQPEILALTLISAHAISRFATTSIMFTHKYARDDTSKSKSYNTTQKLSLEDLIFSALFGLLPLILLGFKYFLIIIPLFFTRQIMGWQLSKRINGYTGDTLGAVQQISEVVFYIFVLII